MKLTDIPAGCTITALVTLDQNISEYDAIYLYLFTSVSNPIKFYFGEKKGWIEAVEVTANQLKIVAPASVTKNLSGELFFSIAPHDSATTEIIGRGKKSLGINVKQDYPTQDV